MCVLDLAEAKRLATDIANGPTVALAEMKKLLNQSPDVSLDEQLEAESFGAGRACPTPTGLADVVV